MGLGLTIDYAKLQQEAMRGVVRAVLQRIFKTGLPGEHHFYISFHTQAPGVILSKRLKEKYPQEMTIVLQHRFWDLIVSDDRFEVKLSFDGIPERLVVPFAAIKVFIDPSVRYGLQFDDDTTAEQSAPVPGHALTADAAFEQVTDVQIESNRTTGKKPRVTRKARNDKQPVSVDAAADGQDASPPAKTEREPLKAVPPEPVTEVPEAGPKVISLDQFRKK